MVSLKGQGVDTQIFIKWRKEFKQGLPLAQCRKRGLEREISADELTELQARLERLELPDETKFEIENLLCDYLEIQTETGGAITSATVLVGAASNTVGKMHKLVGVSQGLVSDATLSRRLKKQFDLK